MTDFNKIDRELDEAGFKPGTLVRCKKEKSFYQEHGTPVLEQLPKAEEGQISEWIRGEKFQTVKAGTVLMFLGNLKREVNLNVVDADEIYVTVPSAREHRLLCFLYEQKILWWDFNSLTRGAEELVDKFEVLNSGEEREKGDTAG